MVGHSGKERQNYERFRHVLISVQKKYPNIFLSLSTVINGRSSNHISLIKACAPNRILVESDYNTVDMCAERTWDMVQVVAKVKGWKVENEWTEEEGNESDWGVIRRLESNWKRFQGGNHQFVTSKRRQRQKREEWLSDSENDE